MLIPSYLLLFGIDINSASRRKFYTTLNYCTNTFGSSSNVCLVEEYQDCVSGHGVTSYNDIVDLVGDSATASTSGRKACGPKERKVSFGLGGGNGNGERNSGDSGLTKSEWKKTGAIVRQIESPSSSLDIETSRLFKLGIELIWVWQRRFIGSRGLYEGPSLTHSANMITSLTIPNARRR